MNAEESLELKKILDRSPMLTTTYQHVREFAEMLTQRQGQLLTDWLQEVEANGAPELQSFASGLHNDLDAVTAGLTTDYSSGVVEGTDNRIRRSSDRVRASQIPRITRANPQPSLMMKWPSSAYPTCNFDVAKISCARSNLIGLRSLHH